MPSQGSHRHLDAVELPDGSVIWVAAFPGDDYQREQAPDFGLYLDPHWQPPWPHAHVDWVDFGLPTDDTALRAALVDLLSRARNGATVEVGCLGAHGRTGTALACLATLSGVVEDPVVWVRSTYCRRAVETDEQAAYARRFGPGNSA